MAKNSSVSASAGAQKLLLLVDCVVGKCGSVVEVDPPLAKTLIDAGEADDNPAAIAAHEG